MRLKEFTAPKDTVLTQAGINPNPNVDSDIKSPEGKFSPLGTQNERPTPLTANHAVTVDKKVKELKKLKEYSFTGSGRFDKFAPQELGKITDLSNAYTGSIKGRPDAKPGLGVTDVIGGSPLKLAKHILNTQVGKGILDLAIDATQQFGKSAGDYVLSVIRDKAKKNIVGRRVPGSTTRSPYHKPADGNYLKG